MKRRPKIYPQNEKSSFCGACATASVLDYFGVEPDPIPVLYTALRGESRQSIHPGMYASEIQSYLLRRDWIAILGSVFGPSEKKDGSDDYYKQHEREHQRIATWRCMKAMLQAGFLCILDHRTVANTRHFNVVYDAYFRKGVHWLRFADSQHGYMELQAASFFTPDSQSSEALYVKPDNLELR